jgi:hypothetical protein
MATLLIGIIIASVLAIAFWITQLVKDVNERFDQIEHKLDVIIDQLENSPTANQTSRVLTDG